MTSSYQNNIIKRYYEHKDTLMVQKLSELVSDLYLAGESKADRLWENATKALRNLGVDEKRYARMIAQRDVKSLAALVGELSMSNPTKPVETNPTPPPAAAITPKPAVPVAAAAPAPAATATLSPDTLKSAFKAFKKRIKLTQLDDESKIGRSPLTGGKTQIVAIQPPREYPQAVWDELVKQGRLKTAGRGFYQIGQP